jgi:hypothetical protein
MKKQDILLVSYDLTQKQNYAFYLADDENSDEEEQDEEEEEKENTNHSTDPNRPSLKVVYFK